MTNRDRNSPDEHGRAANGGPTESPEPQSQEQKLQSMISALWERSRHTVEEDLRASRRVPQNAVGDDGIWGNCGAQPRTFECYDFAGAAVSSTAGGLVWREAVVYGGQGGSTRQLQTLKWG